MPSVARVVAYHFYPLKGLLYLVPKRDAVGIWGVNCEVHLGQFGPPMVGIIKP